MQPSFNKPIDPKTTLYTLLCFALVIVFLSACSPAPQTTLAPSATPALAGTPTAANAPLTVSLEPVEPEGGYLPNQPITLKFSEAMSPQNDVSTLIFYPPVSGKEKWSADYQTLTFSPDPGFNPGATYALYLAEDLKSTGGKIFTNLQQWQLSIHARPQVLSLNPKSPLSNNPRPEFFLTFNQEMDPKTFENALQITPTLKVDLYWAEKNRLKITPLESMQTNQTYEFQLAGSVTDITGISMDEVFRWTQNKPEFTFKVLRQTIKFIDFQASYPIDIEKAGLPFTIKPPLNGSWEWTASDNLRFTPVEIIADGTVYTLNNNASLPDLFGSPLSIPVSLKFMSLPAVKLASPQGDQSGTIKEVVIEFTRPVNMNSVEKSFQIEPFIAGNFRWKENTMTYRFSTTIERKQNIPEYTYRLGPEAKDAQGNTLSLNPLEWSFRPLRRYDYSGEKEVTFGQYGSNLIILDPYGEKAVAYGNYSGVYDNLQATLHTLAPTEFAKRYNNEFEFRDWDSLPDWHNTKDLPLAASWKVEFEKPEKDLPRLKIPRNVAAGIYILSLSKDGNIEDQIFLVLSHYSLVAKSSGRDLLVWATNTSGNAIKDMQIRVFDNNGAEINSGTTDEEGLYRAHVAEGKQPMLVFGDMEGDRTVVGFSRSWRSSNFFGFDYDYRGVKPPDQGSRSYIYTERPIYKPGQTIYFKAILRDTDDIHYFLPEEGAVSTISLLDSKENIVETVTLTPNSYGTVAGSFQLAEGAMLGTYSLKLTYAGLDVSHWFKVQEYRKPDYYITIESKQPEYVDGETAEFSIDTRYFFGEPVPNAELQIQYYSTSYDLYSGSSRYNPDIHTIHAKTDQNGLYTYKVDVGITDSDYYYDYDWNSTHSTSSLKKARQFITVSADDGSGQIVEARLYFTVNSADEFISINSPSWFVETNQPIPVNAYIHKVDGSPIPARELTLAIAKNFGKAHNYKNQGELFKAQTDENGKAQFEVVFDDPGLYRLHLYTIKEGQDKYSFETNLYLWVYQKSNRNADSSLFNYYHLSLMVDRTELHPYDQAQLLILSEFNGPGLITFERGHVIHTKSVMLTAPLTVVPIQVIPEDAPNIFVTVNAWETSKKINDSYFYERISPPDAVLRMAQLEIPVESSTQQLKIEIQPDQNVYEPGQNANLSIHVNDSQGKPVQAELSVAIVDEPALRLVKDYSLSIFDTFFGRRPNSVTTYDSRSPFLMIQPPDLGGGGDNNSDAPDLRSDFEDTAQWFPVVETDKNGVAQISVPLPDNITSWRVTVKAVTLDTKVGENHINIETRKSLLIRPTIPSSSVEGDVFELQAMAQNYLDTPIQANVTLSATHIGLIDLPTQKISLQPNENRLLSWKVLAKQAGTAEIVIEIDAGAQTRDAVKQLLEIQPRIINENVSQAGIFTNELITPLTNPVQALEGTHYTLDISRSPLSAILDGAKSLIGYPYGCVEQIMSKAMPNAVIGLSYDRLGIRDEAFIESLKPMIHDGLQRLYAMQHADGGWGWWPDDKGNTEMSAYVLHGLAITTAAGYPVEPQVIENGAAWLDAQLENGDLPDEELAYALYSLQLSGIEKPAQVKDLLSKEDQLSTYNKAILSLLLEQSGDTTAARLLLDSLGDVATNKDDMIHWDTVSTTTGDLASPVRTTSIVLMAYARLKPEDPDIPAIVRYLMSQRKGNSWENTQDTSFAIMALSEITRSISETGPSTYEIIVKNQVIYKGEIAAGSISDKHQFGSNELPHGSFLLRLRTGSANSFYYSLESNLLLANVQENSAGMIKIEREYYDTKTGKKLTAFQKGQLVEVKLTLTYPEILKFVIIEDHLPAGLEAVNSALNYTSSSNLAGWEWQDYGYTQYFWEDYGYNNKEIRGQKISFFRTELWDKVYEINYKARALYTGSFVALPAESYAMYQPDIWGRSDLQLLEVVD